MADQKISQLSDGGNAQAADEFVVARSGANYRIDGASVAAAATSVGTLSSLTVSGDLTVDTSTLKVDSANNRVGIGTASPGYAADVAGQTRTFSTPSSFASLQYLATYTGQSPIAFGQGSDATGYLINLANASLAFGTNSTERMRLDASGNLGLGVTPSYKLDVQTSTERFIVFGGTGNATASAVTSGGSSSGLRLNGFPLTFGGNGASSAEHMRLDSSGHLLVGATANPGILNRSVVIDSGSSSLAGYILQNDTTGRTSADGSALYISGSSLNLYNLENSPLLFGTNNTERARITSGGDVVVNGTAVLTANGKLNVWNGSGAGEALGIATGYGTSAGQFRLIYLNSAADALNFDNGNNNATLTSGGTWTNASDARIKTDIVDIKYGLDTVLASKPRSFGRVDVDGEYIGFVAQELLKVVPEVVYGDEDTKYSVDYGSLVAVAFKAIQDQQVIIKALEARLEALEA